MFDFTDKTLLWLIPGLPLLAAALTLLMYWRPLRKVAHIPCVIAAVASCVLSVFALTAFDGHASPEAFFNWFSIGDVNIRISLRLDGLSAIMLVTVTFIGSWIAIYSTGYMHGDPGYPRYFAEVSLFLAAMTGLVLADNFILLYACWEGVGVCSYLLIGFWYAKPAAAAAARKAFLVTRIGDVGMFLGILLIFGWFANTNALAGPDGAYPALRSLDFREVFGAAAGQDHGLLVAGCLLLFCGAVGKSAQFPLHVWLPDAMEGPSPVSALIHAATMVTAGVYLVARCTPMFAHAPEAQFVVALIGAFTALIAALMALTQPDLKRVLAYSTISQLGYMFLALGSGLAAQSLVPLAVIAGIFHLFTHAFFKALLFLSAGSVMHAMGGVIDMRRFGGLRRIMPWTHWTFLCGAAALAGVPLLSGFWSKDEILAAALGAGGFYAVLFIAGLVTAGLTAFYTFRAYFMTFWGETRVPQEAGHHAHESPPVMVLPLVVLAVGAVAAGFVVGPLTHWFETYLTVNWLSRGPTASLVPAGGHAMNIPLMLGSSAFALGGIALAWWLYVRQPAMSDKLARALPGPYELSRNRFYLDEIYDLLVVRPLSGLAQVCRVVDAYVVDGLVDLMGRVPSLVGYVIRPIQNGLVQFYALLMARGVAGFLLSVLLR